MGTLPADQMREEQQSQADKLGVRIARIIEEHGAEVAHPMLGAVISALASNLGHAIGMVGDARARKSCREEAAKLIRAAERAQQRQSSGHSVEIVRVPGRH